jgi:hypothetical protein
MQEKINILNELKEVNAAFLLKVDNKNCFEVPEYYFDTLPGNVLAHIFIESLPIANPYTIPAEYFKNLPEIIVDKIGLSFLEGSKENVFSAPAGYFETLSDDILKKIRPQVLASPQQELNEISPLLSGIPKTNVYAIPEGYFGQLDPIGNVQKNNNQTGAKIVSIGNVKRKWLNYAAAACIAAFISISGYLYFSDKSTVGQNSSIPSLAKMDVQKEISVLSDDEIDNYLKANSNTSVYTSVGDDDQQQNMDVQDLLQNVSDQEIQQYLNQDPEAGETGGGGS